MSNSVYVTLSQQMVLRRQMDIIANNIANSSTTAFKSEQPLFEEFLVKTADGRIGVLRKRLRYHPRPP